MWLWFTLCSALLLGFYDVVKKQSLKRNSVLWVLFIATGMSSLFLSPFLTIGSLDAHVKLVFKAFLVTCSWIAGLAAMKTLPLTTVSTIKASRPMFVVLFSILLFGERLSWMQWCGIVMICLALFLLGRSSNKEGIHSVRSRGMVLMWVSVLAGAASALYDKHIIRSMEPLFVQSWANVYITVLMGLCLLVSRFRKKDNFQGFLFDWHLVLIAVLITLADALYFFALKDEAALLSVISMVRRGSVLVTFIFGALLFKEHNIRDKALVLAILLGGVTLLLI